MPWDHLANVINLEPVQYLGVCGFLSIPLPRIRQKSAVNTVCIARIINAVIDKVCQKDVCEEIRNRFLEKRECRGRSPLAIFPLPLGKESGVGNGSRSLSRRHQTSSETYEAPSSLSIVPCALSRCLEIYTVLLQSRLFAQNKISCGIRHFSSFRGDLLITWRYVLLLAVLTAHFPQPPQHGLKSLLRHREAFLRFLFCKF